MSKSIHGFVLQKSASIPELKTKANLYIHLKTKAQLLSLINADENKSFGITFKTPPSDSTGIAHILEHSVLCGSKNYPLKEPFIELVKGSLNTFLNAFTYPDKTSYPVASTNEKDFYNLVRVYLDAVFFPLLSRETLMQEGWHIHQETEKDEPQFRGIVYNEMKGAYSSPDRALWDTVQASLLPDTPYRYDSGGDPLEIPNLTYENFLEFHKTHYHPTNALLFFSGDDPETKRLALADEYLSHFDYQPLEIDIPHQTAFTTPVRVTAPLAIAETENPQKKGMVTMNWLWPSATARSLALRLKVLSFLLSGTAASPLRKKLTESGIGEDIAGGGVESDLARMIYSIGLRGMDERQAQRVESIIIDTLQKLADKGFSQDAIDAAMNTFEFSLREQNSGSFPRGLALLYGTLTSWLYGGDPIEALAFAAPLEALKQDLAAGVPVFEKLIREYLLDNKHRSTVILHPDPKEQERRESLEKDNARKRVASMPLAQQKELIPQTKTLIGLQTKADTPELLARLPKLTVADLPKKNTPIPTERVKTDHFELLTHGLPTNGIIYLDLVFDMRRVPRRLLPYIPLFTRTLTEMGTAQESYDAFVHRINKQSGGVWTQLLTNTKLGTNEVVAKLMVRTKFLESQVPHMDALLTNVLLHANLGNSKRFAQMVLEEKSEFEQDILESGHQYVDSRIRRQFRTIDQVDEEFSGIHQLLFLRELAVRMKTDWKTVQADLELVRQLILATNNVIVNVTADPERLYLGSDVATQVVQKLHEDRSPDQSWGEKLTRQNEVLLAPTSVNYVGRGANLYDHGYTLDGSSIVISRYLRSSWLWEQVRMKGGAYGAFSTFDFLSGSFTFLSYRDPHIQETLDAFARTAEYLRSLSVTEDELAKAVIGTISDFDHYMLPDSKGMTALTRYLVGMTDAKRQTLREQILSTSEADFHSFATVLESVNQGPVAVVTSQKEAIKGLDPVVHQVL